MATYRGASTNAEYNLNFNRSNKGRIHTGESCESLLPLGMVHQASHGAHIPLR